jgi:thioredoxin 1
LKEKNEMGTPDAPKNWPTRFNMQPEKTVVPGSYAAKISIIAAVIVIVLNFAEITILKERSLMMTVASIAVIAVMLAATSVIALAAVIAGLVAGVVGLIKAWGCTGKSMMPLAIAGLLLNGTLIATGFVKKPMLGRWHAKEQTATSPSGRKMITEDWVAKEKDSDKSDVIEISDSGFDKTVNSSNKLVLVDCYATWCGPCRMMTPIIEGLAREYKGKVKVCKLNVDNAHETSAKFSVRYLPTIILFKNGREQQRWTGFTNSWEISSAIAGEL